MKKPTGSQITEFLEAVRRHTEPLNVGIRVDKISKNSPYSTTFEMFYKENRLFTGMLQPTKDMEGIIRGCAVAYLNIGPADISFNNTGMIFWYLNI